MNTNYEITHFKLVRGGVCDEKEPLSETRWQIIQNSWNFLKTFNFRAIIESKFTQFPNKLFYSFHTFPLPERSNELIKDTNGMKACLMHPRNDTSGWFALDKNSSVVYRLFKLIFPRLEFGVDDLLLTCHKEQVSKYRNVLIQTFQNRSINEHYAEDIQELAQRTLSTWSIDKPVNISKEIKGFVIKTISQIVLGYQEDDVVHYSDIIDTMDALEAIYSSFFNTKEDKEKIGKAPDIMAYVTEKCLEGSSSPFIQKLKSLENESDERIKFTRTQSKLMLAVVLFTAYKTTVTALIEIFWQLASHSELQEKVNELKEPKQRTHEINKIIKEGLRCKPPAYVIPRSVRQPLMVEFQTDGDTSEIEFYGPIQAGSVITMCPFLAAKNPKIFPNPEVFDPERHQTGEAFNEALIFGFDKHSCVGRNFFWLKSLNLISEAIEHHQFSLVKKEKPESKGLITDHFIEDLFLNVISRSNQSNAN